MNASGKSKDPSPRTPKQDLLILTDLEQIKVLSDPLRVQILEGFMKERTTKQVADHLGEKPTKLYHHVDALERVGLIELTRTQQNRGTLEKYYVSVARGFKASSEVFASSEAGGEEEEALGKIAGSVFDRTSAEFMSLLECPGAAGVVENQGALTSMEIRGTEEEVLEIRKKLEEMIEWIMKDDKEEDPPERNRRFRLTLAYYPLDLNKETSSLP